MSIKGTILIFASAALVSSIHSDRCPTTYQRFTKDHTFCKPASSSCHVLKKGVNSKDKSLILKFHNEYRSKVATGKEPHAGGLPTASNMMEMVWDSELEVIAQKHAETCVFKHDCNNCRKVARFPVGQNIAIKKSTKAIQSADWHWMIKKLYDEVSLFNKKYLKSYSGGKAFGHFSQIIWATTYKIGCGWVLYKEGMWYNSYFVCNYGPAGNMNGVEVYKPGKTCSACPKNSCCGSSCSRSGFKAAYPGLCKILSRG
ncbi:Venom allergen 5, partial [Stegodyphus mimosarum]